MECRCNNNKHSNGISSGTLNVATSCAGSGNCFIMPATGQVYNTYYLMGNGTYGTTVSIPSGNNLTPGSYSGSASIYFLTTQMNLNANMTVNAGCTISASSINFGTIDPFSSSDTKVNATITANCTNTTAYNISIGPGNSGDIANRTMSSGANRLKYQLYSDSNYLNVCGNGSPYPFVSGTGNGTNQTYSVYGKALGNQTNLAPGSYDDAPIVTIAY